MKLEFRYNKVILTDLTPGDMITDGRGNYKILTQEDINEIGELAQGQMTISNRLETVGSKFRTINNQINLTLYHIASFFKLPKCGKIKLIDKNDELIQIIDVSEIDHLNPFLYYFSVEYECLLPLDNLQPDEIVSSIKFIELDKDDYTKLLQNVEEWRKDLETTL